MARDRFAEVFDFKGTFKAGGKEATEGRDEGGEGCEDEDVKLHWGDVEGVGVQGGEEGWEAVGVGDEDGVGGTL